MRRHVIVITALLLLVVPRHSTAQDFTGFLTGGDTHDINDENHTTVGGGALVGFLNGWIAGGGQLDVMMSWPYFAARGGPLFQGAVLQTHSVRLFGLLGYFAGEDSGANIGGGGEFRVSRRIAIRATFQDTLLPVAATNCAWYGVTPQECDQYFHGGRDWTGHEQSFHVGVAWH